MTRTLDSVRGATHVVTRQTKGRAPAFGMTRTFDSVRGATHVVIWKSKIPLSKDKMRMLKISHRLKSKADVNKTQSPLLLRSKPIVKPYSQWEIKGASQTTRGKHLFLFYYMQNKQNRKQT